MKKITHAEVDEFVEKLLEPQQEGETASSVFDRLMAGRQGQQGLPQGLPEETQGLQQGPPQGPQQGPQQGPPQGLPEGFMPGVN